MDHRKNGTAHRTQSGCLYRLVQESHVPTSRSDFEFHFGPIRTGDIFVILIQNDRNCVYIFKKWIKCHVDIRYRTHTGLSASVYSCMWQEDKRRSVAFELILVNRQIYIYENLYICTVISKGRSQAATVRWRAVSFSICIYHRTINQLIALGQKLKLKWPAI